ncbi:hypothetical protein KR084_004529 [Drosophila pseudotakahashii]|nr:hypothetical protein KR084_004529 [Drosophila pseudotakahashii]
MDSAESPTKTQAGEDENYSLLCQAHEQFKNSEFDRCLELLQELETRGESSGPVLRHNRAVVSYHKTGCTQHSVLLKELEALTADADAPGEASSGLSLKQGAAAATVARYNRAVIYYHRHMFGTALEKLAPLVARLEALEKAMAALVATLQLQLLLATNQLNRAEAFLDYLQYKLNLVATAPSSNPTEEPTAVATASPPAVTPSSVVATPGGAVVEGPVPGLGGSLQLLQLITLVLNRKPVVIQEDGTPEYAALKAQQYYIMKDFQMAAKQLMRINNECTQAGTVTPQLSTCIANNMGVIHLRVRHYAIAAKFFQNALNFDQQLARNLRQSTLQTMSSARSCEILYNLGVAMLHLRRPKEAFQCFLVPVKQFHSNPRLWLRMAEACIMEHEAKLVEEERQSQAGSSPSTKPYAPQSAGVPEPTLEFAALCLRSALTLTQHYKTRFHMTVSSEDVETPEPKDPTQESWRHPQDNNFCNPSKPVSLESLEKMTAAIYAAHSFVSLRLGDDVTALEMAEHLLACERLSDAHKLLGHMYAGEALMLMDKAAEARDHLDPTFVGTLNAFDFETRDWQLKSVDAAQNVVRYNLAVAMALQNDLPQAKALLANLSHSLVSSKALALRRFIDLKMGPVPGGTPS